jgi:D-threo-aldose 1-dehydrogenase
MGMISEGRYSPDIRLAVPGLALGHLGYGCSQLMGGITRRESIALLQTALDAGIRHFDTAPSYGYGHAESVVGEALRSRRDQVTITTKYGIRPPRNQNLLGTARRLLIPITRRLPGVKSRLSSAARGLSSRAHFSASELRISIDASLATMQTDYIDILLLHEAVIGDLNDELFEALERSVKEGKIRSFGVGSKAVAAADIYRKELRFCPVMQFEWSVLSGEKPAYPGSYLITHGSLSDNFVRLRAWLGANPKVARAWSKELELDIASGPVVARLMLAAARYANADGMILFSSRDPDNIRTNARAMLDNRDLGAAAAFSSLVTRHSATILTAQSPEIGI